MKNLNDVINQILSRLQPSEVIRQAIHIHGDQLLVKDEKYDISGFMKIAVLGIGKASSAQVGEVCRIISANKMAGKILMPGLAFTKYGHSVPAPEYEVFESAHPICDDFSIESGKTLKAFLKGLPDDSLLIFCLSGGASALVVTPRPPFTLEDLREITTQLIFKGNPIDQVNIIRRELSEFTNGGLVALAGSKTIVSLITSDIPIPRLPLVGSGPTLFEELMPGEVVDLVKRTLTGSVRDKVVKYLESPERKQIQEEVKHAIKSAKVQNITVSDFTQLMSCATEALKANGVDDVKVIEPALNTDIKTGIDGHMEGLKQMLNNKAHSWAIISGGELTVDVKGRGQGGRNTEFVLWMTKALFRDNVLKLPVEVLREIEVWSVGTDGTDARTDYAGAWMNFELYKKSVSLSLQIDKFLANNDSLNFFRPLNSLIKTGPTQTNLMDLRTIVYRGR